MKEYCVTFFYKNIIAFWLSIGICFSSNINETQEKGVEIPHFQTKHFKAYPVDKKRAGDIFDLLHEDEKNKMFLATSLNHNKEKAIQEILKEHHEKNVWYCLYKKDDKKLDKLIAFIYLQDSYIQEYSYNYKMVGGGMCIDERQKGHGTEILEEFLKYALVPSQEILGVVFTIHPENKNSKALVKKFGPHNVGLIKNPKNLPRNVFILDLKSIRGEKVQSKL